MSSKIIEVVAAFWRGYLQNGLVANDMESLELIANELLQEGHIECFTKQIDGWQIKPVMLIDPQELTRLRLISEWAKEAQDWIRVAEPMDIRNGVASELLKEWDAIAEAKP